MTRRQIHTLLPRAATRAPSIVVAAAGNLDHATVVRLVARRRCAGTPAGRRRRRRPRRAPARPAPPGRARRRRSRSRDKDTEQAHLVLGGAGIGRRRRAPVRPRRAQQRARRRHVQPAVPGDPGEARPGVLGLLLHLQYADTGLFGVYAGCAPGKVDEVLALTRAELAAVAADGITDEELARGKGMLKGSLVLGLEDTGSRMSRLAKGELLYGDLLTVDELLARVDAVTLDEVNALAAELLTQPMSLAVVGPFDESAFSVRPLTWDAVTILSPPPVHADATPDRRKRRIIGMPIWAVLFAVGTYFIGVPTSDPLIAFGWLWLATIAWRSDLPWRQHLLFLRDWLPICAAAGGLQHLPGVRRRPVRAARHRADRRRTGGCSAGSPAARCRRPGCSSTCTSPAWCSGGRWSSRWCTSRTS